MLRGGQMLAKQRQQPGCNFEQPEQGGLAKTCTTHGQPHLRAMASVFSLLMRIMSMTATGSYCSCTAQKRRAINQSAD